MNDQLERFIEQNRLAFDEKDAPDSVWSSIPSKLRKQKSISVIRFWRMASMFSLLLGAWIVFDQLTSNTEEQEYFSAQFLITESSYNQLILDKKQELAILITDDLKDDFQDELFELDLMYQELQKTFLNEQSYEIITHAMVANLEWRIQILNEQLMIIKSIKMKDRDEKNTFEI